MMMDPQLDSSRLFETYFYIFQTEAGECIVEYVSKVAPPFQGQIMNLRNITPDHDHVEVTSLERIPGEKNVTIKVTVKPVPWHF